ncbi:MAG: hypothetical protein PHC52_14635, partial [Syntrophales bacterium]|nr:hypothetical protein [Syntrophales bacterium]
LAAKIQPAFSSLLIAHKPGKRNRKGFFSGRPHIQIRDTSHISRNPVLFGTNSVFIPDFFVRPALLYSYASQNCPFSCVSVRFFKKKEDLLA